MLIGLHCVIGFHDSFLCLFYIRDTFFFVETVLPAGNAA